MSTNLKNALCPLCGHRQLHEEVSDYKADFRSESGEPRSINVTAVKMLRCDACGETILGEESENRISEAQRAALGLLTAFELEQFKSIGVVTAGNGRPARRGQQVLLSLGVA